MGAIIVGLRPGDHEELKQIAERIGRPVRETAGILLEEAIRCWSHDGPRGEREYKTDNHPAAMV